jgi:UrcA family protein
MPLQLSRGLPGMSAKMEKKHTTTEPVRTSIIVAVFLAATLLHPVAFGAGQESWAQGKEPVAFTFRFNRADLDTQRGAAHVQRALTLQATQACTASGEPPISLRRTDAECVATLVQQVVRKIGSESLSALWRRSRSGPFLVADGR